MHSKRDIAVIYKAFGISYMIEITLLRYHFPDSEVYKLIGFDANFLFVFIFYCFCVVQVWYGQPHGYNICLINENN